MDSFQVTLDRDQFERARVHLETQGILVPGDEGIIDHDTLLGEVELSYLYSEPILTVTITKHPPFTVGKIQTTVRNWFRDV